MLRITSLPASALSSEKLSGILADYFALDQARVLRRLLVARFGLLAIVAAVAASLFHGSPLLRWLPPALFAMPPLWAWISELRVANRLSHQLDAAESLVNEKVIKSP